MTEYSFRQQQIVGGIGADAGFWEGLEDGVLRMPRCAACHEWQWPALWRCPHCGGWEQEWVEVEPTGTIYSWTRCWTAFDRTKGRAEDVPYVVVLAHLPQCGIARVIGVLKGSEDGLKIGAPVVASFDPPSEKTYGYAALRWSLA